MYCCKRPDCQDIECPGRPAAVARIGRRDYTREELPPSTWRQSLKGLCNWVLMGLLGWLIWGTLIALVIK